MGTVIHDKYCTQQHICQLNRHRRQKNHSRLFENKEFAIHVGFKAAIAGR